MTKIEALELELAARKMVEGTGLDWRKVIKLCGAVFEFRHYFDNPREDFELALGIVEDRPVWEGDKLYCGDFRFTVGKNPLNLPPGQEFSWNPPTQTYDTNHFIRKNKAEIQSGQDRQRWAEGLILQMPTSHNGRNSWLLNYGVSDDAKELRKEHPSKPKWSDYYQSAETVGESVPQNPKTVMIELPTKVAKSLAPLTGRMREEIDRLKSLLSDAADTIEGWGTYASPYFKEKWDLADNVARFRETAGVKEAEEKPPV